ncbi:hypothetical protein [Rheinheimera sp.]|uniref:hypothetical protein n=1 Tax=Rheinheimera sp. TaxID=1869214 RepID=UPI0027BACFBF|nr:hypothetical protein [Rheinheimera sp.]
MELVQIFIMFLLLVITLTLIVVSIKLTDLLSESRAARLAVQNIEADELFQHGHLNQQARLAQQDRQEEILLLLRDIASQMSLRQPAERYRASSTDKAESNNQAAVSRFSQNR